MNPQRILQRPKILLVNAYIVPHTRLVFVSDSYISELKSLVTLAVGSVYNMHRGGMRVSLCWHIFDVRDSQRHDVIESARLYLMFDS